MANHAQAINEFVSVTGADPSFAESFLESNGWQLQQSINNFLELGATAPSSSSSSSSSRPTHSSTAYRPASSSSGAPQYSLMGDEFVDAEGIPAPRPHRTEQLLGDSGGGGGGYITRPDPFRNYREEHSAQQQQQWKEPTLATLFKPPTDIIYSGSFDAALEVCKRERRWLLVNIQSQKEFSSHRLNRDTWARPIVKECIQQHFIFWQRDQDTDAGLTTFLSQNDLSDGLASSSFSSQTKPKKSSQMLNDEETLKKAINESRKDSLKDDDKGGDDKESGKPTEMDDSWSEAGGDVGVEVESNEGDGNADELFDEGYTPSLTSTAATATATGGKGREHSTAVQSVLSPKSLKRRGEELQSTPTTPPQPLPHTVNTNTATTTTTTAAAPSASIITTTTTSSSHDSKSVAAEDPIEEEPPEGADVTRLQVRLFSGARAARRFHKSTTVSTVHRWIRTLLPPAERTEEFTIATAYPKKRYTDLSATLEAASLLATAVVLER